MLFIFAVMTPLGFLTSKFLSDGEVSNISQHFDKIMAVVIGIFLHISTTILFESGSADHHKFNKKKMAAVFLGIGLSLTTFLFPTHNHSHSGHSHSHDGHNHEHSHDSHNHEGHDHSHGKHEHDHDEHEGHDH
jgi:zinc and cadmium transporter